MQVAAAVAASLQAIPPPERIIISQPVWTSRTPSKFERSAWVSKC